jgi:hypothetical protein
MRLILNWISDEARNPDQREGPKDEMPDKLISTKGVVVPADWDENGMVIAIAISTHEEDEYLIDHRDKKGKDLLKMIQQEIEVVGLLKKAIKGRSMIKVKSYRVTEEDDAPQAGYVQMELRRHFA